MISEITFFLQNSAQPFSSLPVNEYKVWHGFKDGTNCIYDCGSATETILHILWQWQHDQTIRP